MLICSGAAGCFPDRPEPEFERPSPPSPASEPTSAEPIEPTPLVPIVELPEPEPEPPAFVGRETVRVDELLAALTEEVPRVAASEPVAADYAAFLEQFELSDDPELYLDYVRIKIAFEATRAGGWWGLHWAITNEQPNSEKIWAAWRTLELPGPVPERAAELPPLPNITATAECDELSALFAFVAQRIGLSRESEVGLLWPTGNHVVAVWTIHPKADKPTRVVIPTSQIFLGDDDSLGTRGFNPWRQKTIFDYRRQDAAKSLTLPGPLASAFVQAVREHGGRSQAELQELRNAREERQTWAR
ncbi:MAG TPA: hypothetical protein VK034_32280 [Enhygromyxa sp.]|nr:hypothetical protein [Enhygromyxa sp.]